MGTRGRVGERRSPPAERGPRPPRPLQPGPDSRKNQVSSAIGAAKLNGRFYTPLEVADAMLERVRWPAGGGSLLDPACGEGVFLEAALRKIARLRLSREDLDQVSLAGWDLDPEALREARRGLAATIAGYGLPMLLMPRLHHRDALETPILQPACVVGNPPYLESKRMPEALKARIRERFPAAATGAFDLYGAFVALTLEAEPEELSLLLPNRFLVTANAAALRRELQARYELEITDLSRERVFGDAAVYPVVIHGRRRKARARAAPEARSRDRREAVLPILPPPGPARELFRRLRDDETLPRLADALEIRWTVSFHRAGLRDAFVSPPEAGHPASPHARPFLGGQRFSGNREVEPCRIAWRGAHIDYDEARARAAKNPLPPLGLFEGPALVICQNARRLRCAVDTEGHVLKDTFLHGRPRGGGVRGLKWLALVLQSDLMHFFYEHLWGGTRKAGGHLHFLGRTLEGLPLPPGKPPAGVEALYRRIGEGDQAARARAEALVRAAYGVTATEEAALAAYPFPPPGA
ncbi:MAG: Eco57I restriction-modification methylase domain-containing protein [Deltaproteobacteria bacterium]|nr:Eco57I restriction-modification methylase domain-containing protein [Deltaproteobacteria bacterium]